MLKHLNEKAISPKRVVILGAKGFVGAATAKHLKNEGIDVVAIGRKEIDLCEKSSAAELAKILRSDDALIVTSAVAPCKNHGMMLQNIQIMNSVCDALSEQPVQHVIYISSDAVYADSMAKLNESSPAAPTSLHGAMHVAREKMLQSIVNETTLAILRPSLLYGAMDPHNGYGPNSFYRLVQSGRSIELFGQGEEKRDHVYIDDVAELIHLCLLQRSYGILNITTGEVNSFHQIAVQIAELLETTVEIKFKPRSGPMPHDGYRAFDNTVCNKAFKEFQFTLLPAGLNQMHQNSLLAMKRGAHERS